MSVQSDGVVPKGWRVVDLAVTSFQFMLDDKVMAEISKADFIDLLAQMLSRFS